MLTKVQGLALNKTPFQERNLVVKLLLRSGKKASVLFYGGRGGGAKKKSSTLELGTMMDVELRVSGKGGMTELVVAKEWLPLWTHQRIRYDYKAFTLMCLFLEISEKVALEMHWPQAHAEEEAMPQGAFRVLSNALYHLEASVQAGNFSPHKHLLVFTGKLLAELGVYPQRGECVLCGGRLAADEGSLLMADKGGLACLACMGLPKLQHRSDAEGPLMSVFLERLWHTKYADMLQFLDERPDPHGTKVASQSLINYLMYQFHWDRSSLKALQQL